MEDDHEASGKRHSDEQKAQNPGVREEEEGAAIG